MRIYLALALLACARVVPYTRTPRTCQAQAVDLVWRDVYGRTDRPPDVWWVPREALTCQEPGREKGLPTTASLTSGCMGGNAWAGGVDLIWYYDWIRTDLAHEFAHVAKLRNHEDPDVAHLTAAFGPGGAVAQANARLAEMTCHDSEIPPRRPAAEVH
jgi:hypothetical protein